LVTAGERRRQALLLLAKVKRIKKTAAITCLVKTDGNAGAEAYEAAGGTIRIGKGPPAMGDP
jgi:hypothetical protein